MLVINHSVTTGLEILVNGQKIDNIRKLQFHDTDVSFIQAKAVCLCSVQEY